METIDSTMGDEKLTGSTAKINSYGWDFHWSGGGAGISAGEEDVLREFGWVQAAEIGGDSSAGPAALPVGRDGRVGLETPKASASASSSGRKEASRSAGTA
ncbi:hypothetical protein QJS04_geneDACA008042 [Acorus gramineus]|uniref:Uncharacterized protein n=1 Tax=Acorus gramineus TaxID=55184 RepID=A0AAV9BDP4_ACOGR|nr:hypothetical protein QJS04_geneDACA008042 [Acorus gramineus]